MSLRQLPLIPLLLIGIGGPFAYLAASPIYSSGDEAAHVDYAYQIWLGQLPVFDNGLVLQNPTGSHPPVQWTAQHPPLLYLMLAPVVGPLVDAGQVAEAGMAARAVICVLAAALVLAVRWFTRLAVPTLPGVADLAAVMTGLSVWFIRLGGSVYNDILAALTLTLASAFLLATVRSPRRRYVIGFVAAVCAASLTRISLLPLCFILLTVLLIQRWRAEEQPLLKAATTPFLAGCAVLLASGWFYLRNLRLTGGITGGHPDWAVANLNRAPRPVLEVLADTGFWASMLRQFATPAFSNSAWEAITALATALLLVVPVMLGVRAGRRGRLIGALPLSLIATFTCGVTAMQVSHVAGAGAAAPRYFFILVPFVTPIMALGLWHLRRRWTAIGLWLGLRLTLAGAELHATLSRTWTTDQAPVFPLVAWGGYGVAILGTFLVINVIRRRTESGQESRNASSDHILLDPQRHAERRR